MKETIFIGVAWPYANGPMHQGQMVGSFLPADVFARFHRQRGDRVLMVSGTDQHGTPVTVRAEQEGRTPQEVVDEFHQSFVPHRNPSPLDVLIDTIGIGAVTIVAALRRG